MNSIFLEAKKYKRIVLKRPALMPPSHLYCLEPLGVGTTWVESLTGYIARLAEAHCVSTAALFGRELIKLVKSEYWQKIHGEKKLLKSGEDTILGYGFLGQTPALNGAGETARDWIQVLETATLRSDLSSLTLIKWGGVLSTTSLVRSMRAWCPACYEERRQGGLIVYEPLIWSLSSVTSCSLHRRRLQTTCDTCKRQYYPLSSRSRPGFCSTCGNWLGSSIFPSSEDETISEAELKWQEWVINNISELLSASPTVKIQPTQETITKSLDVCINQNFEGIAAALSRAAQIPENTISNWRGKYRRPKLGALLLICHKSQVSLLSFLTQTISPIVSEVSPSNILEVTTQTLVKAPRQKRKLDLKEAKRVLTTALREQPPPSLAEVVRRVERRPTTFRHHLPELCSSITRRHAAYLKTCRSEKWVKAESALRTALKGKDYPSTADVERKIGWNPRVVFPSLCRQLSKRHVEGRKRKWLEVEHTLEKILKEWPPLPMREIVKRTGYSASSLKEHYPILCLNLRSRYRQYKFKRGGIPLQGGL